MKRIPTNRSAVVVLLTRFRQGCPQHPFTAQNPFKLPFFCVERLAALLARYGCAIPSEELAIACIVSLTRKSLHANHKCLTAFMVFFIFATYLVEKKFTREIFSPSAPADFSTENDEMKIKGEVAPPLAKKIRAESF